MILIPKITKPTTGIIFTRYSWKAEVTKDGKRRYYSLGIKDPNDLSGAIEARDKLHRVLKLEGAVVAGTPEAEDARRHSIDPANRTRYIHKVRLRSPWKVVIDKKLIGCYPTQAEAILARNTELGLNGGGE